MYNVVSERDLLGAAGKLEKHLAEVETDRVKATPKATFGIAEAGSLVSCSLHIVRMWRNWQTR